MTPLLSFAFIIVVAAIPGLAWLVFFLREDIHPEPRKLIIYTFATGVFMSIPIFFIELLGQSLIFSFVPSIIILVLFLALVEEVFKFFAANLAVGKSKELDEPIDAMIYMVAAAMGLATIENFFILSNMVSVAGIFELSSVTDIIVLRFVGATFLHALTSGFVGYYWARSRILKSRKPLIFGLIFATMIHAVFNYLILTFQDLNFLIYPSLFLVVETFLLLKDFKELRGSNAIINT